MITRTIKLMFMDVLKCPFLLGALFCILLLGLTNYGVIKINSVCLTIVTLGLIFIGSLLISVKE